VVNAKEREDHMEGFSALKEKHKGSYLKLLKLEKIKKL
jgi:hypothetical protein